MPSIRRLAVGWITLALALAPGSPPPAAAAPAAPEILRAAATRYRQARRIHLAGDIVSEVESPRGPQRASARFEVASEPGGRVHDNLEHPSAGALRVSDGKRTWTYVPRLHQYLDQSESGPSPTEMDTVANQGMIGLLLSNYRGMGEGIDAATLLPEESVELAGRARRCHVIEVRYRLGSGGPSFPGVPRVYWIDQRDNVVLKQRTITTMTGADGEVQQRQTETFQFTVVSLDQPLPDSLFRFRPPADARKVEQFTSGRQYEDLTGQTASDFTLPDLQGRKHSLHDHRGSVVLLDFWATWCGPCRIQMPNVEKLHHEFKDKGLVVYAVNQGEGSEKARQYLEKNKYTTTALLDQKAEVGRQYKVAGIPTLVVVGRDGKIVAHFVGVRPEAALREALKKAGIQ